jgi:malonyl CoA-acyl carrier protein transacylase
MTQVCLFPGQGSHRPGMGQELFPRYPHLVASADRLLGYSIAELCLAAPADRLGDTRFTQCAMYVVNALSYIDHVRSGGAIPDVVAGHSLGEYSALFAAGAFDFLTGLELVAERARLMAGAGAGAMLVVIGLSGDEVREVLDGAGNSTVDIANLNAPSQTVISGPPADIADITPVFAARAEAAVPLKVSGAFHSRYMAGAAGAFGSFLRRYHFGRLRIPVISNVTARRHTDTGLAELLTRQLTEPVRWTDSIRHLLAEPAPEFHEIGPGRVLAGLVRQIAEPAAPVAS